MVDLSTKIKHKKAAFSIIEIMIGLLIIGIIAAIAGPSFVRMLGRAKVSATKASMQNIKQQLLLYNSDMGHYPTTREGLNVLIEPPTPKGNWQGPYIEKGEKGLKDGWGHDYEYNSPPVKNKNFRYYELISYGATGEEGSDEPEFVVGQ